MGHTVVIACLLLGQVKLVTPEKDRNLRELLPDVADVHIQKILKDPTTIYYTKEEMPKAYQFSGSVHSAMYNISSGAAERQKPHGNGGNGNVEFPWKVAGGTDKCNNSHTFHFVWFPKDSDGRPKPMVTFARRDDSSGGYAWVYPVDTVFGEVMLAESPDGHHYPFELRIRIRRQTSWGIEVYRPYPTAVEFASAIEKLQPAWKNSPVLTDLLPKLRNQDAFERAYRLEDDSHPSRSAFRSDKLGVDELPDLKDNKLVSRLLTATPFRAAAGEFWKTGRDKLAVIAPTTDAAWHIIPARYHGNFVGNDSNQCMRCHDSTNVPVDRFDYGRDWYGRVRGSDGIFTFHPFSLDSISHNGYSRSIAFRKTLTDAGIVEPFNSEKHDDDTYRQIRDLR